jgi:hypothetical protein
MNPARDQAFEQRLSQCPGPWTATRSFVHSGDPRILCLRWIVPGARWCSVPEYLEFLDHRQHRLLLRCFVQDAQKRFWSFDELTHHLKMSSADLEAALTFCEYQEFLLVQKGIWSPGPHMEPIRNLGATFEWAVMENLQRFHQAIARRCVTLQELEEQQPGDLDVLAFTDTGKVITVECKSSPSGISRKHITRFLRRATLFPADIALLLIDTPDTQQVTHHLTQILSCLGTSFQMQVDSTQWNGNLIHHLQKNVYLANTGEGIQVTLRKILEMDTWSHLSGHHEA